MAASIRSLRGIGSAALVFASLAMVPEAGSAQVMARPPALSEVTRRIQMMSPNSGPAGTEVRVRAEGLRPNTRVHIGIGELQGCGYQVCAPAQIDGRGAIETTLIVPDWGHYDHYEVVMILNEDFVPVAVSDPFHIVDEHGMVRREGRVDTAWPGCPALVTEDGVAYALLGEHSLSLMASQGETVRVRGRIVGPACTLQSAIEVTAIETVP